MNTITLPTLADGERYAGLALDADGNPTHHLVLLPGAIDNATWAKASEFAAETGGELPTRQEQALLYANCKEQFEKDWYWSSETHASNSDSAWMQDFYYGGQGSYRKAGAGRARAIRRLPL